MNKMNEKQQKKFVEIDEHEMKKKNTWEIYLRSQT